MSKPYLFFYYLVILVLLTFYSCSKQKGVRDVLVNAENIVEQQPDSALQLLNTILFPEDLNKSLFNKYNLLLLQAKDKSDKDITSDTVIFAVKDYYVQKKDYPNAAMAAFYCGRVWHERDNMEKAVKAYMEAENLAGKTENDNLKGLIQANLGILHRYHSSYDKAILSTKKAIGWYDKAKNYRNEIDALRITGDCFGINDKIDSAFYYYNESLNLAIVHNMFKQQSDAKNSMGVTLQKQGNYEQAIKLFHEAFAIPNDSVEQARILLNIARVYGLENKMDSVKIYLDKASAMHIGDPWLIRVSYLLKSEIAEKNKQYQDALNNYKEYYNYTEKVFNNAKNNELLEVQGKYDFEQLKTAKKESEVNFLKLLTIISLGLLGLGIFIFIYDMRYVHSKNLLLKSEQKVENLQKTTEQFSKRNYNIMRKLVGILCETALLANNLGKTEKEDEKKLLRRFNKIVYTQEQWDWHILYQMMNDARNGLYDKVRKNYSQLSESEFRVCCLTCETELSDKEIGIILGRTDEMVRRIRSDLRKKIGIPKGKDLITFFENAIQ